MQINSLMSENAIVRKQGRLNQNSHEWKAAVHSLQSVDDKIKKAEDV